SQEVDVLGLIVIEDDGRTLLALGLAPLPLRQDALVTVPKVPAQVRLDLAVTTIDQLNGVGSSVSHINAAELGLEPMAVVNQGAAAAGALRQHFSVDIEEPLGEGLGNRSAIFKTRPVYSLAAYH